MTPQKRLRQDLLNAKIALERARNSLKDGFKHNPSPEVRRVLWVLNADISAHLKDLQGIL
jgi:hypothetical protein